MHVLNSDTWFIFNLHREFFFILHIQVIMSRCTLIQKERKGLKYPNLERKSLTFSHPLPAKKIFIYIPTTLTRPLLPSGTSPLNLSKSFSRKNFYKWSNSFTEQSQMVKAMFLCAGFCLPLLEISRGEILLHSLALFPLRLLSIQSGVFSLV